MCFVACQENAGGEAGAWRLGLKSVVPNAANIS